MFEVKDDLTIYATRGDVVLLTISADDNGNNYTFRQGDVLRMKIFEKKDCSAVVMQKDFDILEDTEYVDIALEGKDTRLGEVISKPKTYWYEIELNPDTMPHTIIGYGEEGAKLFILLPEGKELGEYPPPDIPTAYEVQAQLERVETVIVPQAESAATNANAAAGTASAKATEAAQAATRADAAADAAESYTINPPKPIDGYWHLWDGTQYIKSEEPSGGSGTPGANGLTPYIKDGYWWIGEENTNVKAEGKDGKDGVDGYTPIKGVDYFDGRDGAAGYTPVKGVDYFDGAPGKDGAAGPAGPAGAPGATGAAGKDGVSVVGATLTLVDDNAYAGGSN